MNCCKRSRPSSMIDFKRASVILLCTKTWHKVRLNCLYICIQIFHCVQRGVQSFHAKDFRYGTGSVMCDSHASSLLMEAYEWTCNSWIVFYQNSTITGWSAESGARLRYTGHAWSVKVHQTRVQESQQHSFAVFVRRRKSQEQFASFLKEWTEVLPELQVRIPQPISPKTTSWTCANS